MISKYIYVQKTSYNEFNLYLQFIKQCVDLITVFIFFGYNKRVKAAVGNINNFEMVLKLVRTPLNNLLRSF